MYIKIPAFILLSAFLSSCGNEPEIASPKPLRPVKTMEVRNINEGLRRELPGVVDALRKADLSFRVPGKLETLLVREGELVSLGQALAQLDKTDYKIQLQASQGSYDQASADFKRAHELVKKDYISGSDYDGLKAKASTASANLDSAKQNLAYTTLYAPFSGIIAKRYIENFEDMAATQPVFALHDLSAYTIRVDVPESFMISQPNTIPTNVEAVFESIPQKTFPLIYKERSSQPDKSSKTYEVTFIMNADPKYNILPGMTVSVQAQENSLTTSSAPRIFMPPSAVMEDAEERFVYLAIATEEQIAVVKKTPVTTGQISEQGLEILNGLKPGDQVVIAGVSNMHDGLKVKLLSEDKL